MGFVEFEFLSSTKKILVNKSSVETLYEFVDALGNKGVAVRLNSGVHYVKGTLKEVHKQLVFEKKERPMARPHL